ncbi:DUF86 domain-containing protein [Paramagnetospirillum kuznetsovii]|uniref:DUF86 domain-containing protein n=1 Tax=Paramagnetospirillum kuznetsovii TaxID=2053833 RepID=A0A364NUF8_9PROT|nr:HepT-like ribonuclease domain-containing protein [Paramagnetospirillum kuznetsovii]RAU20555.1 DUF86 domain-containing protein [Paramagnetospirillum kuznetsovii]
MSRHYRDEAYLLHIRDCCAKIRDYSAIGAQAFLQSQLHQDAVVRNFQIIGEAAKNLSEETKAIGGFQWRDAIAFRNFIVHQYMGVDYRLLWDVIQQDLPALESHILSLLAAP